MNQSHEKLRHFVTKRKQWEEKMLSCCLHVDLFPLIVFCLALYSQFVEI